MTNPCPRPLPKVVEQDRQRLTQTFAATRPIAKGEEVFIYYNDDFEEFVSPKT